MNSLLDNSLKVIINIATTGTRQEFLQKTLKSLEGQYDELNIYDNSARPDFTDNSKFYFLQFYDKPVYYLTCDDRIEYPSNYVTTLIKGIEKHKCIVTFHGRQLIHNQNSYYKGNHRVFSFQHDQPTSQPVNVAGTGVMGFRTDYFNPTLLYLSEQKRMSDLIFSLEAKLHHKKIICLNHCKNWIKSRYLRNSISATMSKKGADETKHVELMKQILR